MNAETTTIAKFIESILFEEYKKADAFLNQIVENKMRGKVGCACEDERTEPFKSKKGKKKAKKNGKKSSEKNKKTKKGDKEKPKWLKNLKKK